MITLRTTRLPGRLFTFATTVTLTLAASGSSVLAASVENNRSTAIHIPLGEAFSINAGLSGSYANEAIPGQGIFVDVDPANQVVFMAWFTYGDADPDADSIVGHATNRWFVAVGNYEPDSSQVVMTLSETEGGVFDKPGGVVENEVGSLTLNFVSCSAVEMDYSFDNGLGEGQIDLTRLTPADTCQSLVVQ